MLILVPLDGSSTSDLALWVAADMARRLKARLALTSVVDMPYLVSEHQVAPDEEDSRLQTARLGEHLGRTKARLQAEGFEVETHLDSGRAPEKLIDCAARWKADLIVISSHGRAGLGRWLLGSVADKMARHAPCPVLVVRGERHTMASFLVPLDGTAESESALTVLRALLQPHDRVALARVIDFPTPFFSHSEIPSTWADARRREIGAKAQAYLEEQAGKLDYPATLKVLQGHPAQVILEQAATADMIIMGTHSSTLLQRTVFGSVAERVLHHAPCPVLLVRGEGALRQVDLDHRPAHAS